MKIEANGLGWRGVASVFRTGISETTIVETTILETASGDGLNLRPNN